MAERLASFQAGERLRAAAWKRSTATIPDAARVPAPYVDKVGQASGPCYEFCLPASHAALALLPEVRMLGLELFVELGIPWHAGVAAGPSNHLLSSQVQCVNALGQMVHDPARLIRAFGPALEIGEVLRIEADRYLTFEYIGEVDFFGEAAADGQRTRGAYCTSVDAAFLYRTFDGFTELALVEWKYTEHYRARVRDDVKDAVRLARYGTALNAADGPVRAGLVDFADLVDEPLYQLMRQQLLAHELERVGAHGADRVRVVHVSPVGNIAYQHSLHRVSVRALGSTVREVWALLLRYPDRFVSLDSAICLDPLITSDEYVQRYGPTLAEPAVRVGA